MTVVLQMKKKGLTVKGTSDTSNCSNCAGCLYNIVFPSFNASGRIIQCTAALSARWNCYS